MKNKNYPQIYFMIYDLLMVLKNIFQILKKKNKKCKKKST